MNCLICKGQFLPNDNTKICEICNYRFHLECWTENGGCGTPGCANLPIIDKNQSAAKKTCPACSETIDLNELVCPFCNEHFHTVAPITTDELKGVSTKTPKIEIEGRKTAITILIFGLLGFTAPFTLLFGGLWYQQNKKKLKETSPLYYILSLVGLSISLFYSVLILVGLMIN